jgi:hypothetical protein
LNCTCVSIVTLSSELLNKDLTSALPCARICRPIFRENVVNNFGHSRFNKITIFDTSFQGSSYLGAELLAQVN